MIKPWLFEFFHQPLDAQLRSDPQAVHEHFRWYIDLWTRADTRDFEGIGRFGIQALWPTDFLIQTGVKT